jgi:phage tail-like protein
MISKPAFETVVYPFTTFNFAIEVKVPGISGLVCNAAFSECDGLELNREVKTIREGGNNGVQVRLSGPVSYGTLSLKRGMTATFDLWDWFQSVLENPGLRTDAEVVLFASGPDGPGMNLESNRGPIGSDAGSGDRRPERARFVLSRCLPIKLKAPAFNAKDGLLAIEECQVAYESLKLKRPGDSGGVGSGGTSGR